MNRFQVGILLDAETMTILDTLAREAGDGVEPGNKSLVVRSLLRAEAKRRQVARVAPVALAATA